MTKFRKIPVTIDAIQWTGENLREVITFTDGQPDTRTHHAGMMWDQYADLVARDGLKIFTLEGTMSASVGDWIIRGIKGEYYPCKPDIFAATYVPADFQPEAPSLSAALKLPEVAALVESLRNYVALVEKYRSVRDEVNTLRDAGDCSQSAAAEFQAMETGRRYFDEAAWTFADAALDAAKGVE